MADLGPLAGSYEPLAFSELLDAASRETRRHLRRLFAPFALANVALVLAFLPIGRMVPAMQRAVVGDPAAKMPLLLGFEGVAILSGLLAMLLFQTIGMAAARAVSGLPASAGGAFGLLLRPAGLKTVTFVCLSVFATFLCCAVPLLYVGPLLAFTFPAMAVEGVSGAAALRRSAQLLRFNPGRRFLANPMVKVAAIYVTTYLLQWLMGLTVALPVMAWNGARLVHDFASGEILSDLSQVSTGPLWLVVPIQVLSALFSTLANLYCGFAIALLFLDTRRRREGEDLAAAIDAMASAPVPPPLPSWSGEPPADPWGAPP